MNESLGGQNEEPKPEENSNEEFDALDTEWEEFTQSLEDSAEREMERMRVRGEYETIKNEVFDRLAELGIPRVIDRDVNTEIELYQEYANAFFAVKREEARHVDLEMDRSWDRQVSVECVYAYFKEREFEALVLNNATGHKFLLQRNNTEAVAGYLESLKKQFQAEFIVNYGRGLHDPWQQFFDEIAPGQGLDMSNPVDRVHMNVAEVKRLIYRQATIKKETLVNRAIEIAGIDREKGEITDVAQATFDFLNTYMIAEMSVSTETEHANRSDLLWQQMRSIGLNSDVAKQVVALFEEAFPIEQPYGL